MNFLKICTLLSLLSQSLLFAEENPLPSDIKEHEKFAQELREKIKEELEETKRVYAQRASRLSKESVKAFQITSDKLKEAAPQIEMEKESTYKKNPMLEYTEIKIPENEKDKYELSSF